MSSVGADHSMFLSVTDVAKRPIFWLRADRNAFLRPSTPFLDATAETVRLSMTLNGTLSDLVRRQTVCFTAQRQWPAGARSVLAAPDLALVGGC